MTRGKSDSLKEKLRIPELFAITGLSPSEDVGRVSLLDSLVALPTSNESSKLEEEGMVERP